MTKFVVPASIADATSKLNGIEALLTATKWQRAAIVYAFTDAEKKGGPRSANCSKTGTVSCREFAELGIKGLKNVGVVASYRKVFAEQVAAGTVAEPVPGKPLDLSGLPEWEPSETGSHEQYRVEKNATTEVKLAAIEKILDANPEVKAVMTAETEAAKAALAAEQELRAKAKAEAEEAAAAAKARHEAMEAEKAAMRAEAEAERKAKQAALAAEVAARNEAARERAEAEAKDRAAKKAILEAEYQANLAKQKEKEAAARQAAAEKAQRDAEARAAEQLVQNIEAAISLLEANADKLTTEQKNRLIDVVAPAVV